MRLFSIVTMSNIFLSSDMHFHHKNILTFKRNDETPLRVFADVTHMNEYIVYRHNLVVGPKDKWYCLGDVTMGKNEAALEILGRMNGEKILIKGNHDLAPAHQYLKYFKDIRATHQLDGFILSHVPIHTESLSKWVGNIHGHLHANVVLKEGTKIPDPRYINVSMEQLDEYAPVSLEELKSRIKKLT